MTLEFLTIAFLVAVFVAAEIWRALSAMRGVIVSMNDDGLSFAAMGVGTIDVRLESGEQITASVNCCTACLGRLRIGDQVRVCHSKEGYVADLPWMRSRRCDEVSERGPGNPFLVRKKGSPAPLPKNAISAGSRAELGNRGTEVICRRGDRPVAHRLDRADRRSNVCTGGLV